MRSFPVLPLLAKYKETVQLHLRNKTSLSASVKAPLLNCHTMMDDGPLLLSGGILANAAEATKEGGSVIFILLYHLFF